MPQISPKIMTNMLNPESHLNKKCRHNRFTDNACQLERYRIFGYPTHNYEEVHYFDKGFIVFGYNEWENGFPKLFVICIREWEDLEYEPNLEYRKHKIKKLSLLW